MEVDSSAFEPQVTALDVTEAVRLLNVVTIICGNEHCDINKLLERLESSTFNEDIRPMATRAECVEILSSSPHFTQTVNLAVTHITESVTRSITDLINDQRDNTNETCQSITQNCDTLRNYFKALDHIYFQTVSTSTPFQFSTRETAVSGFLVGLVKLLRESDFSILPNIPVLTTVSQIVKLFKDIAFIRPVVLTELCTSLEIMKGTILAHEQCFLFEIGFYEKLLQTLFILKDLLSFCVQMGDIYHSDLYQLDSSTLAAVQKSLEEVVESVPTYLVREIQECINLVIP
ncbi:hypothetical protein PPYR_13947 [Photinus pyralis]|uniref:Uncharacterized protein n=1 Tax=Photinus pyralis TaxID=7054 RepID=A0A1Y1NCS2_PHOPY|nr:uncharacterized protein LOC116180840 [Photinus pyralis]XP_031357573.1 uncharacterized protein LOC116181368 [Photinus pyralis]KAB0791986.1 hypothetical protein PPYR_13947 [Photinus pyralis]